MRSIDKVKIALVLVLNISIAVAVPCDSLLTIAVTVQSCGSGGHEGFVQTYVDLPLQLTGESVYTAQSAQVR